MKLLIVLVFLLGSGGAAATERPADYAYGMPLTADGKEALYEVVVPEDVYRGVARADLGDVRIFNGANELVPYSLRPRRVSTTAASEPVAITLFPLMAPAGTRLDGLSINLTRQADGTSSVHIAASGERGGDKTTIGYLVDLTGQHEVLRAVEFDWKNSPDGFAGKLRVDGSDDLTTWRTLVASAPIVSLEQAGRHLEQKRIELPGTKAKYLRVAWVARGADAGPPELTSARGEFAGKTVDMPREWVESPAAKGEKPGEYVFDLRGHFPVDRLGLSLPDANTVVQVEFLSRDGLGRPWHPVARAVVYRLRHEESETASPEVASGINTDRYWLARVDPRGGGIGAAMPKLRAGWVPQKIVFAARGTPPFQLVYGNRKAKPAALPVGTLIPGYRDEVTANIGSATTGEQQAVGIRATRALAQKELGGEARREEPVDWKRWSLWAALVLGVLVLGTMAWRLMRQLNKTEPK